MAKILEGLSPTVEVGGKEHYQPTMDEVRGLAWYLGNMVMLSSFDIQHIVAVTRGGLTPTDCVSRAMAIRDIQTLAVELYEPNPDPDGDPEIPLDKIRIYRKPKLYRYGRNALFVDDVLDQGRTAGYIRETWPKAAIAVVYSKLEHRETLKRVDFVGKFVGGIWVDFPWEVEAQTRRELREGDNRVIF